MLFYGDKLLGGPECGIIVGRKVLIEKIARHPMQNGLQVGKLTLAALTATLRLYRDPEKACLTIPLLQLLSTSLENLKNRAERLTPQAAAIPVIAEAKAVAGESSLISRAMPNRQLPTWCVSLRPATMSVDQLAVALQSGMPSVVGRVHQDCFLFDLRSVLPYQDTQLLTALESLGQSSDRTS